MFLPAAKATNIQQQIFFLDMLLGDRRQLVLFNQTLFRSLFQSEQRLPLLFAAQRRSTGDETYRYGIEYFHVTRLLLLEIDQQRTKLVALLIAVGLKVRQSERRELR